MGVFKPVVSLGILLDEIFRFVIKYIKISFFSSIRAGKKTTNYIYRIPGIVLRI